LDESGGKGISCSMSSFSISVGYGISSRCEDDSNCGAGIFSTPESDSTDNFRSLPSFPFSLGEVGNGSDDSESMSDIFGG